MIMMNDPVVVVWTVRVICLVVILFADRFADH